MTSTGTTANTFNCSKLIELAYLEGQGVAPSELNSSSVKSAIDLIDLILADWNNKGVLSWATKKATLSLVAGTASYSLPSDCIDVLEVVLDKDGADSSLTPMSRIERGDYEMLPDKLTQGNPDRFFVDRGASTSTIYLWSAPNSSTDKLDYWYMRRLEDAGELTNTLDLPYRWVNALQTSLAYRLFKILPLETRNTLANVGVLLKKDSLEAYESAVSEDRYKVPLYIAPSDFGGSSYSGI